MDRARGRGAGGIAALRRLLREYGGAVEADLQRYYGLPLSALGSPALTYRRLRVLLAHLPADSATTRALHPGHAGWDLHAHLLAHLADLAAGANWQRAGDRRAPRPRPYPRPGVDGAARPRRPGTAAAWARVEAVRTAVDRTTAGGEG